MLWALPTRWRHPCRVFFPRLLLPRGVYVFLWGYSYFVRVTIPLCSLSLSQPVLCSPRGRCRHPPPLPSLAASLSPSPSRVVELLPSASPPPRAPRSPPPPLASRTSCRTRSPSLSSPALASQPWRSAAAVAAIAFVSRAFSGRGCSHHLHLSPPGFFPATGLLSRPACNALREPRYRTPPPSLLELTEKGSELAPRLRARSLGSTCFRSVF